MIASNARKVYSEADFASMGLEVDEKLLSYCEKLLQANAKEYTTAAGFVQSLPQFFTNLLPSEVEKAIEPDNRMRLLEHPASDLWSQENVRAYILEGLKALPQSLSETPAKATGPPHGNDMLQNDSFTPAVLQRLISETVEHFMAIYKSKMDEGLQPDPKDPVDFSRLWKSHISSYLRGWVAFGRPGLALADTMSILGPQITVERIQKGKVVWRDLEMKEEAAESPVDDAKPIFVPI